MFPFACLRENACAAAFQTSPPSRPGRFENVVAPLADASPVPVADAFLQVGICASALKSERAQNAPLRVEAAGRFHNRHREGGLHNPVVIKTMPVEVGSPR